MGIQRRYLTNTPLPWLAGMKPFHAFISHGLARWSRKVDKDKYYHLIPVCLLGLPVPIVRP